MIVGRASDIDFDGRGSMENRLENRCLVLLRRSVGSRPRRACVVASGCLD